jgi:hypothetical protein
MATLHPGILFTGSIQDLVAYKRKDSNKITVKLKTGPSKKMIETLPQFQRTRENDKEFGGRSTTAKWFIRAIEPLKIMSDTNLNALMNRVLKTIQEMDSSGARGCRDVRISAAPALLEGLNVNLRNNFDSIIMNPVQGSINRSELTARVTLPGLLPGINFQPFGTFPFYQWTFTLGLAPDGFYDGPDNLYKTANDYGIMRPVTVYSGWMPVLQPTGEQVVDITYPTIALDD